MTVTAINEQVWTARMLEATVFTRCRTKATGVDAQEAYDFRDRAVARVAWLENDNERLHALREQLREALRARADNEGPYSPGNQTPAVAVAAVTGGQRQGEATEAAANREAARILHEAQRATQAMREQAEQYLREARAAASEATRPVVELPEPPDATGDPVADLEARAAHVQACTDTLDRREAALDEERAALEDQRAKFVELLDRLEAAVPGVRAQLAAVPAPTVVDDVPA